MSLWRLERFELFVGGSVLEGSDSGLSQQGRWMPRLVYGDGSVTNTTAVGGAGRTWDEVSTEWSECDLR